MLRRIEIIFLMLAVTVAARAQTNFSSLEDLWKYADAHNVTIRNAGYELNKAQSARKQSYLAFLPQASVNGTFTYNTSLQTTLMPAEIFGGPAGTYKPVQFGQKYIYNGGFSAQMDIVNLQTWYNARIAKETEAMNNAAVENAHKLTYQQIATQYYAYLLNKEAARLAVITESVADSILQSVTNKYNIGTVSLASLDIAKLNKEKAGQTLITARYQMQTNKNNLKGLLDLEVGDTLDIAASLQTNLHDETAAGFAEDPAVRVALYQSQISLSNFRAANANFFPTLSVLYNNSTQQNDNKFEPLQSGGPSWYPASYWTLRLSWNIFNGGSRWLQSKKNKINWYESKMQFDNTRKQSAINDENLRLSYKKATEYLSGAERIMNLSFDNYRHITNKYNEGLSTIDERLNAFTDYINYQNQYLNSLSDMLVQLYMVKIRQQTF